MANDYVTKEEFNELKDSYNDLLEFLSSLGLKQKADFNQFSVDDNDNDSLDIEDDDLEDDSDDSDLIN